jgi:predicted small lipoprotein YifL
MTLRILIAMLVSLSLFACGVKSDLRPPSGMTTERQTDPSKPPRPLGQ